MKLKFFSLILLSSSCYSIAQTYDSEIEAANAGNANAQYWIGSFYERGTGGVERNDSAAFYWYQKAAEKRYLIAQEKLADFYLTGQGVEKNTRKAFELYQSLATHGKAGSMDKLGQCYQIGEGVAKDIYQARDWYIKAIKSGSSIAKTHLKQLYTQYPSLSKPDSTPEPFPRQEPIHETPQLRVSRYELQAIGPVQTIQKLISFELKVYLENEGTGNADDVTVDIALPPKTMLAMGKETLSLSNINSKETKAISYAIMIHGDYPVSTVPIDISIKEKAGKYAEDWHADVTIGQRLPFPDISDIDIDIPVTSNVQPNTYAMIVSEENYENGIDPVPYAINDGKLFREYCIKALGLPEENVIFRKDISKSQFDTYMNQLKKLVNLNIHPEETKILFYYAGHGIPDEKTRTAYLLPKDGFANESTGWMDLDMIYRQLGEIGSQSVTVFLDACFCGQKRDGGSINKDRGVLIKPRIKEPTRNMIVFAAAQNDETAYSYPDKQHGLFTYYLLKKLKETEGETTLGELSQYVNREVTKTSILLNNKEQTPTTDSRIAGWEAIKLK